MEYAASRGRPSAILQLTILGKEYQVAEDRLIWIFQDLGFLQSASRFCWNGDCKNCTITYLTSAGEKSTERACQTTAQDGMIITNMPTEYYREERS